jgi:hypothetical protein
MALPYRRSFLALCSLCIATICVGWSFAQRGVGTGNKVVESPAPETLLPASTLLYFSSDGGLEHAAAWQQTAAYQSLEASGLLAVFIDTYEQLKVQAVEQGEGEAVEMFETVYRQLQDHGLSLAVTVEPSPNGPPRAYATLVLHEAAELEGPIGQLLISATERELTFETNEISGRTVTHTTIPNSPGVQIGWWNESGHLVIVAGIDAVASALAVASGERENITTHPLWTKYIGVERDYDVTTNGWIDVGTSVALVSPIPVPLGGPGWEGPLPTVGELVALAGLDQVQAVVGQSGFKGEALWGETWIVAPAPRRGLVSLSDGAPFTLADLPPLPYATSHLTAGRLDTAKLYSELLNIARTVTQWDPNGEAPVQLEEFLGMVQERLGIDLQTDLFDCLGTLVVGYNDPNQGILNFGSGAVIEVKDAERLRASLNQILMAIQEEAGPELTVRHVNKHGREITIIAFGPTPFGYSYCVDEDWLIVGSPQVIEAFLLRADGKLPHWQPGADHEAGLAALPSEFSSITISDPRGPVNFMIGLAPTLLGFAQVGIEQSGEFPPGFRLPIALENIPPAELVSGPLFPNIIMGVVDDEGVHYVSRSSLPSIPLVSSDATTTVAVVAVGAALLLPAVQQVREAARRSQSQNNLKQLMLAAFNYESTYQSFPHGTIPNEELEPEDRLSWMVELLPFMDQAALYQGVDRTVSWRADENVAAAGSVIETLVNPSAPEGSFTWDDAGNMHATTHYVGIGGIGEDGPLLPASDPKAGFFGYNRVTRLRDVTDGLSNTVAISEASGDYGPWIAGGRSTIRPLTTQPYINGPDGIGGWSAGGCNMALGDGSVRFVSEYIDPTVMEGIATISGGEVTSLDY